MISKHNTYLRIRVSGLSLATRALRWNLVIRTVGLQIDLIRCEKKLYFDLIKLFSFKFFLYISIQKGVMLSVLIYLISINLIFSYYTIHVCKIELVFCL